MVNQDRIRGRWLEMSGWTLEHWGRWTRNPSLEMAGRRARHLGWLQVNVPPLVRAARPRS
jgi:uncharacterized protein YjbJ (UPF0337 family)